MIDGLMSSGDVGRFDENGHLFVEGRDDEMIVSGGENVFPKEVEDCLTRHEAVHEAAAIGVDDDDYGKRLKAFVVLEDGKDVSEDDLKAHVKSNLAALQGARARSSSWTSCRATRPASCSSASSRSTARTPRARSSPTRATTDGGRRRATRPPSDGSRGGRRAPDFELRDQHGQRVRLSSFRGSRPVVLVFFPSAFSPVCSSELSTLRESWPELDRPDVELVAVSCDPMFTLRAYSDREGIEFPMLTDFWPHGEVSVGVRRLRPRLRAARSARRSSSTRTGGCGWLVHNAMPDAARRRGVRRRAGRPGNAGNFPRLPRTLRVTARGPDRVE